MTSITPTDWTAITALANRVGLPVEKTTSLQRRLSTPPHTAGPIRLILGRKDCGIELLLGRWLDPDLVDAMKSHPGRPVVIGMQPDRVQPALVTWPAVANAKIQPGHIITLRIEDRLRPDVLAQLGTLGLIEQLILVVSLNQPLHVSEREFAKLLASYAVTVKVLVVGVPGHEASSDEFAEVSAVAVSAMAQAGFDAGRCLAAETWFANGKPPDGTLPNVGDYILHLGALTASHRESLIKTAIANLFTEIKELAEKTPGTSVPPIPADEQDRLTSELASYLADLGRTLLRQHNADAKPTTTESLQRSTLVALRGWSSFVGVEGHWMRYVERLRPGTHGIFLQEAEKAISDLTYDPGRGGSAESAFPADGERIMIETKRVAVGLGLGIVSFFAIGPLLKEAAVPLPDLANMLLSILVLVIVSVLGYSLASRFIRLVSGAVNAQPDPGRAPALLGWQTVQQRLTTWFREFITTQPLSPADECRNLAQKLGIPEKRS